MSGLLLSVIVIAIAVLGYVTWKSGIEARRRARIRVAVDTTVAEIHRLGAQGRDALLREALRQRQEEVRKASGFDGR